MSDYDPVREWLRMLRSQLERREREMTEEAAGDARLPAIRAWWAAYLSYHLARVDCEEADHVPCPGCHGRGSVIGVLCADCDGHGRVRCFVCNERDALTRDESHRALCLQCEEG